MAPPSRRSDGVGVDDAEAALRASVETRLGEYHDVGYQDVLATIDYLRDDDDSVIAGGSLTLGLGNRLSDLDLVVSGAASEETSRVPLQHFVKSLRVDVWKLRADWLAEIVGRAERVLQGTAAVNGAFGDAFEEADLKLLHRVAFGIRIDGPALELPASRSYREIARDLLVREYAERMREAMFVAQLALTAHDHIGATFNARMAVHSGLHATLYARGLPFTGDKWLRERLVTDAAELLPLHEHFAVLPAPGEGAGPFVTAAREACERLAGLELKIAASAGTAEFHVGDLELFALGDDRYVASPKLDALWALDPDEAETWSRIAEGQRLRCDPEDEQALLLIYRLYANGAAKLRWARGLLTSELTFDAGGAA